MSREITDSEEQDLIARGRIIDAIRHYRKRTGVDLYQAKRAIERAIPETPRPVVVDYRSHAEALAKALERIKACYWATLGGKSVRDADEAFEEARSALSAYREGQKGQP